MQGRDQCSDPLPPSSCAASAARIRTELPAVPARSNSLPLPVERPCGRIRCRIANQAERATGARGMQGVVRLFIRTLGASPASLIETLESVGVVAREDFRALLDDLNGVEGRHHGWPSEQHSGRRRRRRRA